MNDLLLILIFIVVSVTMLFLNRVATMLGRISGEMLHSLCQLENIRCICLGIRRAMDRPAKPPTPKLLKDEVYSHMGKIYFPFLLPAVPDTGKPVKRIVSVAYNGEIVKKIEDAPLTRCRLDLWPDENTEVTVTTYTEDNAGNVSEASTVTETALDVFPPPAPPKAELLIDDLKEVEDDDAGEIEIVELELEPLPPVDDNEAA